MRNRKTAWILAVGLGMTVFAGCGSEEMKNYEQAAQDLEAENFDAALQEYEAAISAGVKLFSITVHTFTVPLAFLFFV